LLSSGCSTDVKIGDAVLCAVIVVGSNTRGYASMGAVVEREHGHSWWHIAVDKGSKYVDVITSLLADYAMFVQVIALPLPGAPVQTRKQ